MQLPLPTRVDSRKPQHKRIIGFLRGKPTSKVKLHSIIIVFSLSSYPTSSYLLSYKINKTFKLKIKKINLSLSTTVR
jgi:hypothetical protein